VISRSDRVRQRRYFFVSFWKRVRTLSTVRYHILLVPHTVSSQILIDRRANPSSLRSRTCGTEVGFSKSWRQELHVCLTSSPFSVQAVLLGDRVPKRTNTLLSPAAVVPEVPRMLKRTSWYVAKARNYVNSTRLMLVTHGEFTSE
jgi:hypothetical protein